MMTTDGAYRTQDMALAIVLVSAGFKYTLERLNSYRACWVFNEVSSEREEEFDDLVEQYEGHACRVEPRSFILEAARVRERMMKFLGEPDRRRPGAPSASHSV